MRGSTTILVGLTPLFGLALFAAIAPIERPAKWWIVGIFLAVAAPGVVIAAILRLFDPEDD